MLLLASRQVEAVLFMEYRERLAISASPSVTTVYSVTGLNGSCSGAATATVNVNSTPTLVANSATLCAGQSTTLTANGGFHPIPGAPDPITPVSMYHHPLQQCTP